MAGGAASRGRLAVSGRLILVRHGETEGNVAKKLDTRLPGAPLTELGVTQARSIGAALRDRSPAALVSSRALRAQQTAGYIESATGVELEVLDGLHETQAGDLEGRSDDEAHDTFKAIFHEWHGGDLSLRIPGGESGTDVMERYVPVLADLRKRYLEGPDNAVVVVVSHGAAIRLVARYLANVPVDFARNNHLDNTHTVELAPVGTDEWECVKWGTFLPPFEDDVSPLPDNPMG